MLLHNNKFCIKRGLEMTTNKKWFEIELTNSQQYAWRKFKKTILKEDTKCALCNLKAETLHHPKPNSEYDSFDDYLNESELKPICHLCHYFFYHANWGEPILVCPYCACSIYYEKKHKTIKPYRCKRCHENFQELKWYLPNNPKSIPIGVGFQIKKKEKDGSIKIWREKTLKFRFELARRLIEERNNHSNL